MKFYCKANKNFHDQSFCNELIITFDILVISIYWNREHFVHAPSQWRTMLHCNIVSHWLGAYTKWSLWVVVTKIWRGNTDYPYLNRRSMFSLSKANHVTKVSPESQGIPDLWSPMATVMMGNRSSIMITPQSSQLLLYKDFPMNLCVKWNGQGIYFRGELYLKWNGHMSLWVTIKAYILEWNVSNKVK